ncbi:MAG: cysteine synthase family protein [Candidatus Diapherotrites archaeon]|nr:cysteine synthase family protein [Candidatus Diapherotrites archaeon]
MQAPITEQIIQKTKNGKTILDFIGNTPFVKIEDIGCKLEYFNPSGSTKDRIAKYIIEKAEKQGLLKKGYKVVEATSGNSGIAFSMVCAVKGYDMIVIMPEGLTNERMEMLKAYGAEIIFTPKAEDLLCEAVRLEDEYSKKKGHYAVKQFENEWNIEAHQKTLGKEILKDMKTIDAFVAGIGTGGTLIGVGNAIRKKFPTAKLAAVEPEESAVMHWERPSHHKIEGIGDGFIPKIIENHLYLVDEVIKIKSKDAIEMTKKLAKDYGILAGISSGANFLACQQLQQQGYKNICTVFPDRGERYLSMKFY